MREYKGYEAIIGIEVHVSNRRIECNIQVAIVCTECDFGTLAGCHELV